MTDTRTTIMTWTATLLDSGERHVVPNADLREHETERPCWCQPLVEDGVIVHNSMDRREEYERGRRVS